jgi:hypothetical protein
MAVPPSISALVRISVGRRPTAEPSRPPASAPSDWPPKTSKRQTALARASRAGGIKDWRRVYWLTPNSDGPAPRTICATTTVTRPTTAVNGRATVVTLDPNNDTELPTNKWRMSRRRASTRHGPPTATASTTSGVYAGDGPGGTMLPMMPVVPAGRSREESTPSVVASATPQPGGTSDWAHAHASLIAVLVLIAFGLAAIALWRTDRQPALVLADEDELSELLDQT